MLSLPRLINILNRVLKELRYRYADVYIEGIKERKSKYEIYLCIDNKKVKIIVNKYKLNVRVYAGLKGLEISLRRILLREYDKEMRLKEHEQ